MRILLIAGTALLAQASAAAPPPSPTPAPSVEQAQPVSAKNTCRKATSYRAEAGTAWRGGPVKPKKLTELPPANSYMAVYRLVNGCEEPLTVAEYRRSVR